MDGELILQVGSWVASGLLAIGLWALRMLHNQLRDMRSQLVDIQQQYVTEKRVKEIVNERAEYNRDRNLISHRLDSHGSDIESLKGELKEIKNGQSRLQGSVDQLIQSVGKWESPSHAKTGAADRPPGM